MRKASLFKLLGAVSAVALTVALCGTARAEALHASDVRGCATQTQDLADQRITACTAMIGSGRLSGEPAGVAYGLRGLAYLDRGDLAHAIADLNRAIELAPDFAPAYQNRGNAWYARGNYGQAIADYDATIKLDPEQPSPYINRATVRRDLGYIDGALDDYAKAISLGADRASPYSGRGQIYLRQRDWPHALADFDRAVRMQPDADNHLLRAQAREGAGDLDRALGDYQDAARFEPQNIAALNGVAGIWRKKGDFDKAIAVYDRAIATEQNVAVSYKLRAEAYAAKGDRTRALADIGRSLKFSWDPAALKVRGALRLDDGDIDGVVHDADALLKLNAEDTAALALRGAAYARKKDYDRALPDLDKAISSGAGDAFAYSARGQIYFTKNDKDRALADLDQAIQRDPRPASPYFMRGALHQGKGEIDQALADINAGLKREPDNATGLFTRAEIRRSKGDTAGAIADYNQALAHDRNLADARKALARLTEEARRGTPEPPLVKDTKVATLTDKIDVVPPPKEPAKTERHEPAPKVAEHSKPHEKDARSHKDKHKIVHVPEMRTRIVRDEGPRYIRAGSSASFNDVFRR